MTSEEKCKNTCRIFKGSLEKNVVNTMMRFLHSYCRKKFFFAAATYPKWKVNRINIETEFLLREIYMTQPKRYIVLSEEKKNCRLTLILKHYSPLMSHSRYWRPCNDIQENFHSIIGCIIEEIKKQHRKVSPVSRLINIIDLIVQSLLLESNKAIFDLKQESIEWRIKINESLWKLNFVLKYHRQNTIYRVYS